LIYDLQNDPQSFALMKFGIGQPVRRTKTRCWCVERAATTTISSFAGEAMP